MAAAAAAIALFAGNSWAMEDSGSELLVGVNFLAPSQDEDWDDASGVEVQARFWQNDHIGLALSLGSDTWTANSIVSEIDDGSVYSYTGIEGDATVTTLGASLLYRSEAMFMELGVRYALIDSSVYAEAIYEDSAGRDSRYEVIDIDNSMFFVARIGCELEMTEDVFFVPSIGYQVDLEKPEEHFAGEPLGETDLRGVTFGIGIVCRL